MSVIIHQMHPGLCGLHSDPCFGTFAGWEVHVDCHKYFLGIDTCMYTTQPWNLSVMCDELYVNRPTDKLKTLLKYCLLPLFYKLRDTIDFQWHSPAVCFGLF